MGTGGQVESGSRGVRDRSVVSGMDSISHVSDVYVIVFKELVDGVSPVDSYILAVCWMDI